MSQNVQNTLYLIFYWISNQTEWNVEDFCGSEVTWEIKQLEVEKGEWVKVTGKGRYYSSAWEPHLRTTGRHLQYGITQCYLPSDTSERAPPNPSHAGWYSIYVPPRDGMLSWPSWPDSPPAGSRTSDLAITSPTLNHCTTKTGQVLQSPVYYWRTCPVLVVQWWSVGLVIERSLVPPVTSECLPPPLRNMLLNVKCWITRMCRCTLERMTLAEVTSRIATQPDTLELVSVAVLSPATQKPQLSTPSFWS